MTTPTLGEQFAAMFQQSFGPGSMEPIKRAEYVSALRKHDWSYEYSDDHSAYAKGCAERKELERMRAELDPSGALWNANAPEGYRVKVAA